MSKRHRIFGTEKDRGLGCNVVNNWMALYFAPSDSLNTCGLQSDSVYLPDWFTKLRLDKLELCKKFPVEESQPLVKFEKETLGKTLEMIWKKDDRIEEKLKNLPKLTGVDRKKSCSN